MDYEKLNKDFPIFLKNIGKENQVQYANSIIVCDSDKCTQYREIWEKHGIPYEHGVMIYLITKMKPYCDEARQTISASDFVIKYYDKFKKFIPENKNSSILNEEYTEKVKDILLHLNQAYEIYEALPDVIKNNENSTKIKSHLANSINYTNQLAWSFNISTTKEEKEIPRSCYGNYLDNNGKYCEDGTSGLCNYCVECRRDCINI